MYTEKLNVTASSYVELCTTDKFSFVEFRRLSSPFRRLMSSVKLNGTKTYELEMVNWLSFYTSSSYIVVKTRPVVSFYEMTLI